MSGTIEQPDQSYYPSALVDLIVRFDDPSRKRFNRVNPNKFPVMRTTDFGFTAKKFLEVKNVNGVFVLVAPGNDVSTSGPQQVGVLGDELTQRIVGIIPLRATLSLNGIRTASTLSCEIPFADLPVEPRMVRGVAISFYLGVVTAEEFQRGLRGETRNQSDGSSIPLNVVPKEYLDGFSRQRTNLRFQGWVDTWEVAYPADSQPMVKLECRDNSTLLIDTECPPMLTINPRKPLDEAFADYLAYFPQFTGLKVEYRPHGEKPPVYFDTLQKCAYKSYIGPMFSGGKLTVWDYFTDMAGTLGHTVRFDGATCIIQRSRTIYGSQFPRRADDTFNGRLLPSGRTLPYRLFVYGRNVAEWNMKRKFTTAGPTTIEVRCYSTTLKRTLVVRYPVKQERLERGLPGFVMADEKIQVFNVKGIADEKALKITAQDIYEQLGRNELELVIRTKDLASFGGNTFDTDLLDCKAGDAIQFEVARDEETQERNTTSKVDGLTADHNGAIAFIKKFGYTDDFAAAYAKAMENRLLQPYFRVKRMDFDWSVDSGVDISVTAINYIEVRGDALEAGLEPKKVSEAADNAAQAAEEQAKEASNFAVTTLMRLAGEL
jgi:hypothetical protein